MLRPDPSFNEKASIEVVIWKWGRFCHADMVSEKMFWQVRNKKEKVARHDKLPLTLQRGLTHEVVTSWSVAHLGTTFPYCIGWLPCRNRNLETTFTISAPETSNLMETTFEQPMVESLCTLEYWLTHLTLSYSKTSLSFLPYILGVQTNVLAASSICMLNWWNRLNCEASLVPSLRAEYRRAWL